MASTEVEEPSQPLKNYKTWVLRVSIHCEGCKRKVKKILQTIPGVHDIDIDIKQQRAVVTGDVAPETLIKKLVKAGKHAELWPEMAHKIPGNVNPSENNNPKSERKNKQESITEESSVHGKEIKPPVNKTEVPVQDSSKNSETTVIGGGVPAGSGGGKVNEGAGKSEVAEKSIGSEKVAVDVKVEEKKPETGSAGNEASQPVVEKKEEEIQKSGGEIGGGAGGGESKKKKKKKKKGQNSNKNVIGETSSSASPPVNGGGGPPPPTLPVNQNLPRHQGYQYPPPHYYAPPPPAAPVDAVSYNTAHPPVNSYTASYYTAPPPYSYAYLYPETENPLSRPPPPPPPSDFDSYPRQPLDSFEMFSDENPNGCWVM